MRSPHRRPSPLSHGVLLVGGLLLGACQDEGRLTVVNHSPHELTAVFDGQGRDLLDGRSLPPGTFAQLELAAVDTADARTLEAYTATGACARISAAPRSELRWEIGADDLDPGGC